MGNDFSFDLQIWIYQLLGFSCVNKGVFSRYIYRELIVFAERKIRCFPVTGHNHLWRGPANNIFDIGPHHHANKFGNWPTRGTRRQGDRDLTHPIIGRPKQPFRDLQSGTGCLRTSLTHYVDRSIVACAIGQCADCVFSV